MSLDRTVTIKVPERVAATLLDAIHCYMACIEGKREEVFEVWFQEDDQTETGGTFLEGARQLNEAVGQPLRDEIKHLDATDPDLQDFLHRWKMVQKYGLGGPPKE